MTIDSLVNDLNALIWSPALIYLCLAMHLEESQHTPEGPVGQLPVEDYPDDLKT